MDVITYPFIIDKSWYDGVFGVMDGLSSETVFNCT